MPPALRVTRPADLAAVIPELLGFVPSESLVVLSLHEPRGRLGLTMRFDLGAPVALETEVPLRLAADQASRTILFVVTEEPHRHGLPPQQELVTRLLSALEQQEVKVPEALLLRSGRWWSYLCSDSCCPAEGTEVVEGTGAAGLLAAERVLAGEVLAPSRTALAASLQPVLSLGVPARRDELERVALRLRDAARVDPATAGRRELERLRRALAAPDRLTTQDALACAVALWWRELRETVLGWAVGQAPDVRRLGLALCRAVPDPEAAPALLVTGAAAYLQGDGALARLALTRAAEAGDLTMAQLLLLALDGQVPPSEIRLVLATGAGTPESFR